MSASVHVARAYSTLTALYNLVFGEIHPLRGKSSLMDLAYGAWFPVACAAGYFLVPTGITPRAGTCRCFTQQLFWLNERRSMRSAHSMSVFICTVKMMNGACALGV